MKAILMFLVSVILFNTSALSSEINNNLKVTTFNIEWYGRANNSVSLAKRDDSLRDFLNKYKYLDSDVIVFQEIVATERLYNKILKPTHNCTTYTHMNQGHQYVMICYKKIYTFNKSRNDNNFILEEVTLGNNNYRPAVHGVLKHNNKDILRVFGVHLKAMPEHSQTRVEQVKKIGNFLNNSEAHIPAIVLGDFNTYTSDEFDDVDSINEVFYLNDLTKVENNQLYTYRKHPYKNQFDHIWASQSLSVAVANTFMACQDLDFDPTGFLDILYYNKYVSDHCPVTVDIKLN